MNVMSTSMRALLLACALSFVGCGQSSSELRIEHPWSAATPPGITVGAAYMTFESPIDDRLIGMSSSIAEKVEVHSMTHENGLMHMRPLAALDLPAGKRVELAPSGLHFMLIGLRQPLAAGSQFQLQLKFEHAAERTVSVQVQAGSH